MDDGEGGIRNPRQLLAATAALDIKGHKLKLSSLSQLEDDAPAFGSVAGINSRPSRVKRWGMGANRSKLAPGEIFLSKTNKGSLIAAAIMRVSKRSEAASMQERADARCPDPSPDPNPPYPPP